MTDREYAKMLGLEKWYQSNTMGNIVPSFFGVVAQAFESFFRFRTIDLKWSVIWLAAAEEV